MAMQAQPAGGQPGIHWFGPGGSGIAYPNPGALPATQGFVPHGGFVPSPLQSVGGGLRGDHPVVSALQTLLNHFSGSPPGSIGIQPQPVSGPGFIPNGGDPSGPMTPNPHQVLQDVVNFHRQSNGLSPMQPEDLHGRVANLAQEILKGRQSRLQQSLRGIRNPGGVGVPGPSYQNYSS